MNSTRHLSLTLVLLWLGTLSQAWVNLHTIPSTRTFTQRKLQVSTLFSTKTDSEEKEKAETPSGNSSAVATVPAKATAEDEEEDDDEFEYEEYETLTEADYEASEWMVGTLFDNNKNNIKETWVRLVFKEEGKNIAIWGDNSEGTWSLDAASQFLAISKEFKWGKQIWAGVVDDYYFCQGTVRGWTYITPASVVGQWQAKRLGVDPDEAGTAPWFEEDVDEEEKTEEAEENE